MAAGPAVPLAAAAATITSGRLTGGLLGDLGDGMRPATELDAYHVQAIAHPLLEAGGYGRQAGWKIGCTTPVMQEYLGIGNPCAGAMFLANVWHGGHAFPVPALRPPRRGMRDRRADGQGPAPPRAGVRAG